MHKSWSVNYTYTNNGSKVSEIIHKSHNDGTNIYEDGYSIEKDNNLREKFYKIKKNKNNNKTIMGKSKNKEDWELMSVVNGNKQYKKKEYVDFSSKFFEKPSIKHRLDLPNKSIQNNEIINYDPTKELESMFQEMNFNTPFNDDTFFKL